MSSELERLADAVRLLAKQDGTVRPHIARASVEASRLASSVPGGAPSAAGAATSLRAAGRSLALASQALDGFARDAQRFSERLAAGGGGEAAGGAAAIGAPSSPHLPAGFTMVPVSAIEDEPFDGYKLDVTPEDLAWGIQALSEVVLPGMARGLTLDDFRGMDAELGQYGSRSYADTYTGFFDDAECLTLAPGSSGRFHPENGRHRIFVARQHGVGALPAKIRGG